MGVVLKSGQEIELIRESSLLVGKTLGEVAKHITPGVSTLKLDAIAEEFIRDHGAIPAFKNYPGSSEDNPFPFTLCISMNDEVVHGMAAQDKILENGDIVSVDCGVYMNGYFGDSAYTFAVGDVNGKKKRLMKVTKESLYRGLEQVKPGNTLGDLGFAIQSHAERHGYSIVREMVGHGIGKNLHEAPEVPNYGRKRTGMKFEEGLVIAIEPMVNMGKKRISLDADGWTIRASDGLPSAHYEHTVAVTKDGCDVLSTFEFIEENLSQNG